MTYPPFRPYSFRSRKDDPIRQARRTAPFIVIDYRPHKDTWKAIWGDKVDRLGKFEGTRAEVIAWARERCDDIRICSDPHDVTAPGVQLGPDDE